MGEYLIAQHTLDRAPRSVTRVMDALQRRGAITQIERVAWDCTAITDPFWDCEN